MPGPSDHHQDARTSINPFEETKPHISEYTAKEIATLSSRLEKQLGPEYISSRPGAGGKKVHYLAADKCINLANNVFGFNGWSSGIQNVQVDFVDENETTGRISLGLSVIVRVTLRDGTYHEDIGYGQIENCKGKAAAFEKAKKEGTTDALKRALRHFGNILGNCIYDKEYVAKVTRLKIAPTKWDPENLHRHPDYLTAKKDFNETQQKAGYSAITGKECGAAAEDQRPIDDSDLTLRGDAEDEFGSDEFDEADFNVTHQEHPDEVSLDTSASSGDTKHASTLQSLQDRKVPQLRPPTPRIDLAVDRLRQSPSSTGAFSSAHPVRPNEARGDVIDRSIDEESAGPKYLGRPAGPLPAALLSKAPSNTLMDPGGLKRCLSEPRHVQEKHDGPNRLGDNISPFVLSDAIDHAAPVGFFTARVAESVQNGSNLPLKAPAFNPHLESPSIRKTAGVDHTKTKPVGRDSIPISPSILPPRPNFINPQIDKNRRVGMPIGAASPLQNRGSYKPLQIKRPSELDPAQLVRPALSDVTSATVNVPSDIGGDAKRQKVIGSIGPGG